MFNLLVMSLIFASDNVAIDQSADNSILTSILQSPLPMIIIMFSIFYFLMIRPQQKKAKAQKEMLNNLKKGDSIITAGGIYGIITKLIDDVVFIEVSQQVRIKISRNSIAALVKNID